MSFLDFFFSSSAQKLEHKGDALFEAGFRGQAKQAYERALDKLKTNAGQTAEEDHHRIMEKIILVGEALAREHQQNAISYLEGGYFDEARELLKLAHEVSSDEQVKKEIEQKLRDISLQSRREALEDSDDYFYGLENDDDDIGDDGLELSEEISEDEEFGALCNTLPEDVSVAYHTYGRHFKIGYVALNQGDFQSAIENLQHALADNPQPDSYIPLELATAYLNLDQTEQAQTLLENFIPYHPEALPAYQLLCEIYWEQKDFPQVEALLASIPLDLKDTVAVILLKGETLYQSGSFEDAGNFYKGFLRKYGWHEAIARELAKTCETLGESDNARNIYKEIIGRCNGCNSKIDPEIKDKYAELSFSAGIYSTDLLEMYLALAREIPDEADRYFDRISRIYEAQGNSYEAGRFRHFSNQAQKDVISK